MQFSLVGATNEGAVWLWEDMGFYVMVTVPGGFNRKELGHVDALITYQQL